MNTAKCEMCGREVLEEELVRVKTEGTIKSVCEKCATGIKGLA